MRKQKSDHYGKITIKVNDKDALYSNSPLLGSSSIGFMFEALFNADNVNTGDEIWERPISGSVYDFEFNVQNAAMYVLDNVTLNKNQEKQIETWIDDKDKTFGLYVNLKVEKDNNPNLGIASRNDLVKLYLEKEDYHPKRWPEYMKPYLEETKDDYAECKPIEDLLVACEEDYKGQCDAIQANVSNCRSRHRYVEDTIKTLTPKLYLIVKMRYSFDTDEFDDTGYVQINDYRFSYIDSVFPHVNWANNRLSMNKAGKELDKKVPLFKEVIHSIVRNEFPPEHDFQVVTLKKGASDAENEVYDNVLELWKEGEEPLKTWATVKEIEKVYNDTYKPKTLPEDFLSKACVHQPFTEVQQGSLLYHVKSQRYLAF